MRRIAPIAVVLALAGCATSEVGREYDVSAVSKLRAGVTTEAEARSMLGTPASVTHSSQGQTVLVYMHGLTHANGFTGRASGETDTLVLRFGPDGKLINYTTTAAPLDIR